MLGLWHGWDYNCLLVEICAFRFNMEYVCHLTVDGGDGGHDSMRRWREVWAAGEGGLLECLNA